MADPRRSALPDLLELGLDGFIGPLVFRDAVRVIAGEVVVALGLLDGYWGLLGEPLLGAPPLVLPPRALITFMLLPTGIMK